MTPEKLEALADQLEGTLHYDTVTRKIYATDASAYRELPLAVAIPKTVEDIQKLILFAKKEGTSLIPRTAGTSLAGQVVGGGIVVDVSREFTRAEVVFLTSAIATINAWNRIAMALRFPPPLPRENPSA